MHEKFTFEVEIEDQFTAMDEPYDEVRLRISRNGYQYWGTNFPASKWDEIKAAVDAAVSSRDC